MKKSWSSSAFRIGSDVDIVSDVSTEKGKVYNRRDEDIRKNKRDEDISSRERCSCGIDYGYE